MLSLMWPICIGFSIAPTISNTCIDHCGLRTRTINTAFKPQRKRNHFISNVRSAFANSELTRVLNKFGVPAVLTHGCGWLTCMVAFFSALNGGVDMNVFMSHLPASFQVLICIDLFEGFDLILYVL
jgi:hypothetical protein